MSLINEALKQANRMQQPPSVEAGARALPLQPVHYRRNGFPISTVLTVLITLLVVAGAGMLWQALFSAAPQPVMVQAAPPNSGAMPSIPPSEVSPPPAPAPAPAVMARPAHASPNPSPSVAVVEAAPLAVPGDEVAVEKAPVVIAPSQAPHFPELKISAILYSPTRPSAMVNGKVLFLGDTIRQAKLISIDPHFVIFEFEGRREKLSMP